MWPKRVSSLPPGYYLPPTSFYRHPVLYDTFGPWLKLHKLWEAEARAIDPHPDDIILDACSGTGALAVKVADSVRGRGFVVGLDLTPQMVRWSRKKVKSRQLHFLRGSVEALPFADHSFSKVSISVALHEMPREARARALGEIRRVIIPGGRVVVGEFWPSDAWYMQLFERGFEQHEWMTEMKEVRKEIEDAGLRLLGHELVPHTHYQVLVARRPT